MAYCDQHEKTCNTNEDHEKRLIIVEQEQRHMLDSLKKLENLPLYIERQNSEIQKKIDEQNTATQQKLTETQTTQKNGFKYVSLFIAVFGFILKFA